MQKTAILFGINKYLDCPLKNAVNDAAALANKLEELGFDVKCFLDIDTATMDRELVTFKDVLSKSNVGLFFFAGHGIQCKGENFLATTSTSFADESSCKYTSLPLNFVIDTFEESGVNTKIIILVLTPLSSKVSITKFRGREVYLHELSSAKLVLVVAKKFSPLHWMP